MIGSFVTYTFKIHHLINSWQDNADDGTQIDQWDDASHDEFADGLLESGHAALSADASPEGGDGQGQRNNENRQDIGEDSHHRGVEVEMKGWRIRVRDKHDPKRISASVWQFLIVQQIDGHSSSGRHENHHQGDDLVCKGSTRVIVVQFVLFSSLKIDKNCNWYFWVPLLSSSIP